MQVTVPRTVEALTQVMTDEYTRKILVSAIDKPKTVEDLSKENDIPISTCYRRVHEMVGGGILMVQRVVVSPDGKRYELYRSAVRGLKISLDGTSFSVDATPNEDMADRLYLVWSALRWQQDSR